MSFSKTLTSAVAAVTVAGAVGLAYAQSTPDTHHRSGPGQRRHEPAGEQHGAAGRHEHAALEHDDHRATTRRRACRRISSRRPTATKVGRPRGHRRPPTGPVAALSTIMKLIPEGELRSDLLAGLKQGVLFAAAALVITLPPAGLATLRAPPPSAAAAIAPIERERPVPPRRLRRRMPASADARFVADWVADSGDSKGLPYLVLDKRDARLLRLRRRRPADRHQPGAARRRARRRLGRRHRQPADGPGAARGEDHAGRPLRRRGRAQRRRRGRRLGRLRRGRVDASRAPGRPEGAPTRAAGVAGSGRSGASRTAASTSRSRSSNRSSGPCFARPGP